MHQQYVLMAFFFLMAIGIRCQQVIQIREARAKSCEETKETVFIIPQYEMTPEELASYNKLTTRLKSMISSDREECKPPKPPLFDEKKFYRVMAEYEAAYTIPGLWDDMMNDQYYNQ